MKARRPSLAARISAPVLTLALGLVLSAVFPLALAWGDGGHAHGPSDQAEMLEQMRRMHSGHSHGHDFEAMERVSAEDMKRMMEAMMDIGLALPPMDSHRGREIFLNKGCVACHSVNRVGGDMGPSLNAADMPEPMNAFDFAARMWRGAPAMAELQEDLLGEVISLSGQDLADLVAFAHDEAEQQELSGEQVPARYRSLIAP